MGVLAVTACAASFGLPTTTNTASLDAAAVFLAALLGFPTFAERVERCAGRATARVEAPGGSRLGDDDVFICKCLEERWPYRLEGGGGVHARLQRLGCALSHSRVRERLADAERCR
jgi:hypothetical protein